MSSAKYITAILLIFFITVPALSSVAFLPYRAHSSATGITGEEYSKIMAATALLNTELEVQSIHETAIGMRDLGFNSETISEDDLDVFGSKYRLSYIITGTVRYSRGNYISESILYSVRGKQIIARASSSEVDIFRGAEKSIKSLFPDKVKKTDFSSTTEADIVLLIDMSYNMKDEWDDLKNASLNLVSGLIERSGINTRVYLIPYSERRSSESIRVSVNSIAELRRGLESLNPAGRPKVSSFVNALNYSLNNIKWRSGASKHIVVVNNSPFEGIFFPERAAFQAKGRNITIHSINGSKLAHKKNDMDRLAEVTGGNLHNIVYRRRVYDRSGVPFEVYLERSRLFLSNALHPQWERGIAGLSSGPEEIYHRRESIGPDAMKDLVAESTGTVIIEVDSVRTSIGHIFVSLLHRVSGSGETTHAGKALIMSGSLSIWVRVPGQRLMSDYENFEKKGFIQTAPFYVRLAPSETYGIELIPAEISIEKGFIPSAAIADLAEVIKKREFYTTGGIGTPPVWFFEFKVEKTERFGQKRDIRD